MLRRATKIRHRAEIFGHPVRDSEGFGVVEVGKHFMAVFIDEKPLHSKSNWVVTGLYFYDSHVVQFAKKQNVGVILCLAHHSRHAPGSIHQGCRSRSNQMQLPSLQTRNGRWALHWSGSLLSSIMFPTIWIQLRNYPCRPPHE